MKHEYYQNHEQACEQNHPDVSMVSYVQASEALLHNKRTTLQFIAAEVKVKVGSITPSDSWVQAQAWCDPSSCPYDKTTAAVKTSRVTLGSISKTQEDH